MSESTASVASPPAPSSSFWEDLIDIFYKPSEVFRRRQGKSAWPPMLFVAILSGIIAFAAFNTMRPILDAEFDRAIARAPASAQTPQATETMAKVRGYTETVGKYLAGPGMIVSIFIVGAIAWVVGKLFGSAQTFQAAIAVAAWAYMPRVLGSVLNAVQGLLMDPASLRGLQSVSIGPARFLDPDTANPLVLQLLGRLDAMIIWETVLLAIGLYVTGKVSKNSAILFGITVWLIGSLPAIRQGWMA